MRVILLILIGLSSLSFAEFSRDEGIVTDTISKLQWQDDAIGSTMEWQEAIDYCENTLELGGYSDWRLPNINELKSIVDRDKYNPAIVNGFENTSSNAYWSSTTNQSDGYYAWIILFEYGNITYSNKDYYGGLFVRCVRAGE